MALFVLSLCPFDISVGVGAFVISLPFSLIIIFILEIGEGSSHIYTIYLKMGLTMDTMNDNTIA